MAERTDTARHAHRNAPNFNGISRDGKLHHLPRETRLKPAKFKFFTNLAKIIAMTKKKTFKFVLILIAILAAVAAVLWLLYVLAPYLLAIIALPTWLAAALADGAKVE